MERINDLAKKASELSETIHSTKEKLDDMYNDKSESWQESKKGEDCYERIECLEWMVFHIDYVVNDLNDLKMRLEEYNSIL